MCRQWVSSQAGGACCSARQCAFRHDFTSDQEARQLLNAARLRRAALSQSLPAAPAQLPVPQQAHRHAVRAAPESALSSRSMVQGQGEHYLNQQDEKPGKHGADGGGACGGREVGAASRQGQGEGHRCDGHGNGTAWQDDDVAWRLAAECEAGRGGGARKEVGHESEGAGCHGKESVAAKSARVNVFVDWLVATYGKTALARGGVSVCVCVDGRGESEGGWGG